MKDHQSKGKGGGIIPFPRLPELLLEKAVNALKSKQYREALDLFHQLSELDQANPQASYGLAVCFVELGYYDEAEILTKKMLEQGIGEYYDVLKLHITVLIQMRKYQSVIDIVQAVLDEGELATGERQNLLQLSEFAKRRIVEFPNDVPDELPVHHVDIEKMSEELQSGNHEQQWSVFYQTQRLEPKETLLLYKPYLLNPAGDPLLKSMMMRDLKDRGIGDTIEVEKYGEV
ncbi:MAG: tetratricopeptide repeat protein, partial [Tuberibacillus sp.]